jgi:hypothetical protein
VGTLRPTLASIRQELDKLRVAAPALKAQPEPPSNPRLEAVRADPSYPFRVLNLTPDPWQARYLADPYPRQALLCCRRAGKSLTSAAKTWTHCLATPDRTALVFSPTLRQSVEYCRYVRKFDKAAGYPVKVKQTSQTIVEWVNGSRLISLPDSHEGVVGFTPTRIVIDEASRVSDVLYSSLRPMLAYGAQLDLLSTPFGKAGFFFEIFGTPARRARFHTWEVSAYDVPRISADFLAEERLELGERWFAQEYELAFNDAIDAVFAADVIAQAFQRTPEGPLFSVAS